MLAEALHTTIIIAVAAPFCVALWREWRTGWS